jgi:hypothetical protein
MWVRGVVRSNSLNGGSRPIQDFEGLARKVRDLGGRLGADGADLAWDRGAPDGVFRGGARDGAARLMQASVSLPDAGTATIIAAIADAGFDVLPDPEISSADVWTPYAAGGGLFGTRDQALRLIGADLRPDPNCGKGVNVVIFDYGIEERWLQAEQRRRGVAGTELGGWPRYRPRPGRTRDWILPGDRPPAGLTHGQMIARNILAIAPAVKLWDAPLLPDTALGPPGIALAEAIFWHVFADWRERSQRDRGATSETGHRWTPRDLDKAQPWILVNAWGALDPISLDMAARPGASVRTGNRWPYWNNPYNFFVEDMQRLSAHDIDVVFAAGNCGTPGGDPRCGETMTGPGRSIHGVNAHAGVLTVGAVRCDGLAVGGSAQGPGALAPYVVGDRGPFHRKPDLCAPSHFHETEGDGLVNTGTSAACGIAAGVLAALRGAEVQRGGARKSSESMRQLLRDNARGSGTWNPRLGRGVINLRAALAKL